MFVINFDFSQYDSHFKFIAINLPVILTQAITYPLQRMQTLLVSKQSYLTGNQFTESKHILKELVEKQQFPKMFQGLRYSLDFSITQMTTKFFVFDFLMQKTSQLTNPVGGQEKSKHYLKKGLIYAQCTFANALATILSQSAFNYQILASSLPIDSKNRNEDIKEKLLQYTRLKKNTSVFSIGLKYTLPVSLYNAILEIFIIKKFENFFRATSSKENNDFTFRQQFESNYAVSQFFTAWVILLLTGFTNHYAFIRQTQLCLNMAPNSIPYQKGLFGTLIKSTFKGIILYGLYFVWFQRESRQQLRQIYANNLNKNFDKAQNYRTLSEKQTI